MSVAALLDAKRPRYQQVAEKLSRDIAAGVYGVGELLPSEARLCEHFGLSRHTVREALRTLEQAGLVARQHGIGTRVTQARVSPRYVQSLEKISDLWAYVQHTRRKVLARRDVLPGQAGLELPGDPATHWRMVESLRLLASGAPVAWTQVCVPAAYADVLDSTKNDAEPVFSRLESRYGLRVSGIRQTLSAVAIPAPLARLLQVKPRSPGLAIVRHYEDASGTVFEATLSIHPADRYSYSMRLTRSFAPEIT